MAPGTDNEFQDFYDPPETHYMIGPWAKRIDEIDCELNRLFVLIEYLSAWVMQLSQGQRISEHAVAQSQLMGAIPLYVLAGDLYKLNRTDWTSGTLDRVLHLQLIRRYYLVHAVRCTFRAVYGELVDQAILAPTAFAAALADLRKAHRTIYQNIEQLYGQDPSELDALLDEEVDLVENLLASGLLQVLSTKIGVMELLAGETGQWWQPVYESHRQALATHQPIPQIGDIEAINKSRFLLIHSIHDTKIKHGVLMALLATLQTVSVVKLAEFLVTLGSAPQLDNSTKDKVLGAFNFAFQKIDPQKLDIAVNLATAYLQKINARS